ncbi:ATP synthase F1 subunit delta [Enterococcus phoeniculicola]|jgi:F-type H+-transporting ATPase subunit delta|uniref:ATP synthase subunit delta n=1 Tax=Enterococcus phoeniculicola ATCC BAA-412 TaxID=1158610 RepID=R3TMC6_9ENTE|nr:ATP synthase F1 subunit delta [Enterococcus phoeniculicola]EOL42188.1 ATP synthase F1, delta subunit [Enterococcus phoeniculicola ATCC BAA-412]EOT79533.1 ATP synthase F1, delta subunit [Enterococcus phoeniculicola ATCC BAA-412]
MKLDKYTVGKRYGKALFDLAMEEQQLEDIYQQLLSLREVYEELPDLGNILSDTRLEPYEKREIMDKLVSHYQGTMKNFLEVVFNYSRMDDLLLMIDEYEYRYGEHQGLISGVATTAIPLSEEQKAQLEEKIAQFLGYKKATLSNKVDPSIIGGVVVEANHQVIDGSIGKQLEKITRLIKK